MCWLDDLIAAYSTAEGTLVVADEVARRLGREPTPAELAAATRECHEWAAWPAPADVVFGLPPAANVIRLGQKAR